MKILSQDLINMIKNYSSIIAQENNLDKNTEASLNSNFLNNPIAIRESKAVLDEYIRVLGCGLLSPKEINKYVKAFLSRKIYPSAIDIKKKMAIILGENGTIQEIAEDMSGKAEKYDIEVIPEIYRKKVEELVSLHRDSELGVICDSTIIPEYLYSTYEWAKKGRECVELSTVGKIIRKSTNDQKLHFMKANPFTLVKEQLMNHIATKRLN